MKLHIADKTLNSTMKIKIKAYKKVTGYQEQIKCKHNYLKFIVRWTMRYDKRMC